MKTVVMMMMMMTTTMTMTMMDGWRQFQTKHTVVAAVGEVGGKEARPTLGR